MFEYAVDKDSELAGLLQKGKGYRIKLATRDLGIKWWTYVDDPSLPIDDKILSRPSETPRLVNSKPSAGHAGFKVVDCVPWPPNISTHLSLIAATDTTPTLLEICIANPTSQPISIQFRGTQRYLAPRDLLGDRTTTRPKLYRTLEPEAPLSSFGLAITNATTKATIPTHRPRPGCLGLTAGNIDPRPRSKDLFTLEPGQQILRHIALDPILYGHDDGVYIVGLREQRFWWCVGSKEDICEEDDDDARVEKELFSRDIPPLVIKSGDTVELKVVNGEVVEE
ncbi:unnamed protein product [Aureobasidium uvarum]|uniref:Uncharacterized protein n=1 Tax=Aureobasidium uvarum TaxID=2773716 RepID=A0A9N8KVC3_9PEZI|nr:unnamed protein product [Aureobasidium uvarum]